MDNDNNTAGSQQEQNAGNGGNSTNSNNAPTNDGNTGIDYGKIQSMIDKGVQQKENAILKSYFEQQGMSEEEVKSAIGDWKSKKQSKAQEQTNTLTQLETSQKELQKALNAERLNNKAFALALDLGIDKKHVPYALKLADFTNALNEKNEVQDAEVQKALEKVKQDFPSIVAEANQGHGFKIGTSGSDQDGSNGTDLLRKAFGLPPKK